MGFTLEFVDEMKLFRFEDEFIDYVSAFCGNLVKLDTLLCMNGDTNVRLHRRLDQTLTKEDSV